MKQVAVSLIKVKSSNALLSMLMVCTHSYLKQVVRYKFLILDTYHQAHYLHEQGCKDPYLFLQAKRCVSAKLFAKHWCRVKYSEPESTQVNLHTLFHISNKSKNAIYVYNMDTTSFL